MGVEQKSDFSHVSQFHLLVIEPVSSKKLLLFSSTFEQF